MAEPGTPPSSDKTTFKNAFVPLEQRESQNVKIAPYLMDWAITIVGAAAGFVAGRYIGKALEPRNIKLGQIAEFTYGTKTLDRNVGQWAGLKIGGIYGLFRHWQKSEGRRLGVSNINGDLKTAMDPEQLKREAEKEEAFTADLRKLEERLAEPRDHAAAIDQQRSLPQTIQR